MYINGMFWWRCSAQNKDSINVAHHVYLVFRMEGYKDGETNVIQENSHQ